MGKFVADNVIDNGLNHVVNNYSEIYLCPSQPADRAAAISTALSSKTGISGGTTGPVNGDTNGRKITINAQTGLTSGASGTANHVAICSGTELLLVTTCADQVITSGNPAQTEAFDQEIADPTP